MFSLLSRIFAAFGGLLVGLPLVLVSYYYTARARGCAALFTCLRARRPQDDLPPPQTLDPRWGTHKYVDLLNTATSPPSPLRLHYVERGDASKPLLLLLHGFPESWWSWRYFLLAFSDSYHVVALDQRGYGLSDAPGSGSWLDSPQYSLRHLAGDVVGVVAALGHQSATLVAHDWGVCVAWAAAGQLDRAGALTALVVLNGPHLASFAAKATLAQYLRSLYIAAFQVPWLAEAWLSAGSGAMLDHMFLSRGMGVVRRAGPLALTQADVDVFKWGMRRAGRLTAALNWYRQLPGTSGTDFEQLAPSPSRPLQAPCLVVWGMQDKALGVELIENTGTYTRALQVVRVEGCSHWCQQDAVEEVVAATAQFLKVDRTGPLQ